jgi:hypothetical protein
LSFGLKKDLSYQREFPTDREPQIELLFSWFGQSITGHEYHLGLLKSARCGMAFPRQPSGHVRVKLIDSGSSVSQCGRSPAWRSKGIHIPSIYLRWLACYQGQEVVVAGISTAFRPRAASCIRLR